MSQKWVKINARKNLIILFLKFFLIHSSETAQKWRFPLTVFLVNANKSEKFYFCAVRRSCSQAFYKKAALKFFVKFIRNQMCWSLLLIKFVNQQPATLLKKRLLVQIFFCEKKFSKQLFFLNTSWWLLLILEYFIPFHTDCEGSAYPNLH